MLVIAVGSSKARRRRLIVMIMQIVHDDMHPHRRAEKGEDDPGNETQVGVTHYDDRQKADGSDFYSAAHHGGDLGETVGGAFLRSPANHFPAVQRQRSCCG